LGEGNAVKILSVDFLKGDINSGVAFCVCAPSPIMPAVVLRIPGIQIASSGATLDG
jgi:hypothetical protein